MAFAVPSRRQAQVVGPRPGGAHERPDLRADHRLGLLQERDHGRVGLGELADRLAQRLERRAQHRRELLHLAERAL